MKKPRFFTHYECPKSAIYMYAKGQMYWQYPDGEWASIISPTCFNSEPENLITGEYVEIFLNKPKRSKILKSIRKEYKGLYRLGLISKKRYKKMMRLTK